MSLIVFDNVTHTFADGTTALDSVSISIDENEFMLLAGRNGSGKTVLMLHMNGLLHPTSGKVLYREEPIGKNIQLVRQRIGVVFQEPDNQLIGQTVAEDVAFGPENLGLNLDEIRRRVDESLTTLGITHFRGRRPFSLSGGEKRKVALAGILAMRPELIVLDEPFAGLDLLGVQSVLESLAVLHAGGHAIIVITHDLDKVAAHANRIVVLENGTVALDTEPEAALSKVEDYGVKGPVRGTRLRDMTWLR